MQWTFPSLTSTYRSCWGPIAVFQYFQELWAAPFHLPFYLSSRYLGFITNIICLLVLEFDRWVLSAYMPNLPSLIPQDLHKSFVIHVQSSVCWRFSFASKKMYKKNKSNTDKSENSFWMKWKCMWLSFAHSSCKCTRIEGGVTLGGDLCNTSRRRKSFHRSGLLLKVHFISR